MLVSDSSIIKELWGRRRQSQASESGEGIIQTHLMSPTLGIPPREAFPRVFGNTYFIFSLGVSKGKVIKESFTP
jgi:hypothetical protein